MANANCGGLLIDGKTIIKGTDKKLYVPNASETAKGVVNAVALTEVPETFADLASVKTYLASLITAMQTAGVMSEE